MGQNVDISIQNLSTPVEKLGLGKRIYRGLQRAGFYTVADIVLAGKPKLKSAKNISTRSADLTWEAAAHRLGLTENQMVCDPDSLEEACRQAWDTPITALPLSYSLHAALFTMGLYSINELIKARSTAYNQFVRLNPAELREIDKALCMFMARAAQARFPEHLVRCAIPEPKAVEPTAIPVPDLSLPLPKLSKRDWAVIEYRAMQLSTLEKTSAYFGVKNKEFRRIFEQAYEQWQQKLVFLSLFLDHFEEKSEALSQDLANQSLDIKTLALHLLSEPTLPDLVVEAEKVEKLIVLIRGLILQSGPGFREKIERSWPSFTMLNCLVEPAIAKHEQVRQILKIRKRARKNKLYGELAHLVLRRAGRPMHFSTIIEEARQLGSSDFIGRKEMHKLLVNRKELFLRVGPGTFALAEWGEPAPDCYPAIIASVLQQANRAMPADWIHTQVCAIRPIKPASLKMILCLHIRFYRSIQNTYGLRGWLPANEAKTISLPDWLVEAPESYKRIGRAIKKGYSIPKIPAEDSLSSLTGKVNPSPL